MQPSSDFIFTISDHKWLDDISSIDSDSCSHGKIKLRIGSYDILDPDKDDINDWTIITSVYRFIKVLYNEEVPDRSCGIIIHCGCLEMITCPISVNFNLHIEIDCVRITDIIKYPSTNANEKVEYKAPVAIDLIKFKTVLLKAATDITSLYSQNLHRIFRQGDDRYLYAEEFYSDFLRVVQLLKSDLNA